MFKETFGNHPETLTKIVDFMRLKKENPLAAFGSNDTQINKDSPLSLHISKLKHCNLSGDLRLFYTISGKDPTIFKLYAVLTHDESGTGQPSNIKRQKNISKQMSNQAFEPFHNL